MHVVRLRSLAVLAVILVVAACGSEDDPMAEAAPRTTAPPQVPTTSEGTDPTEGDADTADPADEAAEPPDATIVRAYVAAVAAGDVDAAMALRCEDARIPTDQYELFADEVEQIQDADGSLGVAAVAVAHNVTIGSSMDLPDPVTLRVRLSFGGAAATTDLLYVAAGDDGARVLCSYAMPRGGPLGDGAIDALADLGPTATPLAGLMPAPGPDDTTIRDEAWLPTDPHDAVEGWYRSWSHPGFGGGSALALRYPSAASARDGAERLLEHMSGDASARITVDGGVGLRVSGWAYTWVQPDGPYFDTVVLLFDDVRVTVNAAGVPTGSDFAEVEALAAEVQRLAAG